jgi:hypothetical protein
MPQLNLNFADLPAQKSLQWEQLDDQQKQIVVAALSRILTKASQSESPKGPTTND